MKERPILFNGPMVRALLDGSKTQTRRVSKADPDQCEDIGIFYAENPCPYGRPGDRLWVRESYQRHTGPYGESFIYAYRATDDDRLGPWRPSIHMPREACRITLELTGVRVERLQDISEADARSEGLTDGGCLNCGNPEPCGCDCPTPSARDSFVQLWESTGGDWHANPWVWVVEFRRIS